MFLRKKIQIKFDQTINLLRIRKSLQSGKMLKTAPEIQFEQQSDNLQKQMQILSARVQQIKGYYQLTIQLEKYSQINVKLKNLSNVLVKIEGQMKTKAKQRNYNQYDLRQRLRKYTQVRDKLKSKYDVIGMEIEGSKKKYILDRGKSGAMRQSQRANYEIQMKNMKKANQLIARYGDAMDGLKQTEQITSAWMPQLHNQGHTIHGMKQDIKEAEAQLSMADQMMRIIRNRNLITKLLLFVLILFMGLADILLLFVKVF